MGAPPGFAPTPQMVAARDVRFPVTNYMPPEGIEFRQVGYVQLPAEGTNAVVTSLTVENGYNGIINYFANEFVGGGFQSGQGNLYWTLYQDEKQAIVVPNFQKMLASLGQVQQPAKLNGIRIKQGQLVQLVVYNVGIVPAGQQVGGLLGGYFYPISLEPDNISF